MAGHRRKVVRGVHQLHVRQVRVAGAKFEYPRYAALATTTERRGPVREPQDNGAAQPQWHFLLREQAK